MDKLVISTVYTSASFLFHDYPIAIWNIYIKGSWVNAWCCFCHSSVGLKLYQSKYFKFSVNYIRGNIELPL